MAWEGVQDKRQHAVKVTKVSAATDQITLRIDPDGVEWFKAIVDVSGSVMRVTRVERNMQQNQTGIDVSPGISVTRAEDRVLQIRGQVNINTRRNKSGSLTFAQTCILKDQAAATPRGRKKPKP